MIEFITLFLGGLVVGPRPVEVMAGDTVAIVEVWLDGELQKRLDSPPWALVVDFGLELSPHFLDAVALDSEQEELGRARQWINMSPAVAQSSMVVEGANLGQGAVARMSWESLAETEEPRSVEVYFDGQELAATDPRSIQLPTFDPLQTHHLRVRLEFTDRFFSEAEAVFGGIYGSEVSTEISAVPIRFDKGKRPRSAQPMRDWFTVGGVPQNVHAVEKGTADLLVVRDVATQEHLSKLAAMASHIETDLHLRKHFRVTFVSPCPEVNPRDSYRQIVFSLSPWYSSKSGTLLQILSTEAPGDCTEQRQQLADAVGVAGGSANGEGSRRAVLLLVSSDPQDRSALSPPQVIPYLARLRVPLWIWTIGPTDNQSKGWGQTTEVRKLRQVNKAFNRLEDDLEHQLIVWLEGLHLPQSVELATGVEGIALVE